MRKVLMMSAAALLALAASPTNATEKKTYTADDVLQSYTCGSLDFAAGFRGTVNEQKQCELIPPPLRLAAMEAGRSLAAAAAKP
jgi:hypothetical protein